MLNLFRVLPEDYLKIFIFIIVLILIYRQLNDKQVLPFLFLWHYTLIIAIFISLFIIEKGIYLFEINRYGFNNYSFYIWTFFTITFILTVKSQRSLQCGSFVASEEPKIFIFIYFFFLVYSFINTGSFDYTVHEKTSIFAKGLASPSQMTSFMKILTYLQTIIKCAFIYYLITSRKKYFYILSTIFFANTIFTHSIGSLINDYFIWLLLRYAFIKKGFGLRPIYIIISIPLFTIYVIVRGISLTQGDTSINMIFPILERFALQGQLFWISINESYVGQTSEIILAFWEKFLSFRNAPVNPNYGLGHYMVSVSPIVASGYLRDGVVFTGGFPGIYIYYHGMIIGTVIFIITTVLIVKLSKVWIKVLMNKNIFTFVVFHLLMSSYLLPYYQMGDNTRFNMRFVFYILLFILLYYRTIQDFFKKAIISHGRAGKVNKVNLI
ncbi:MAG: hypothetical protein IIA61_07470 [Candidatus Marinimicrobia bacterium]|nr:hypothetical protein [Candidatus Neomarinimicrobiota bacterium]